MASRPRRVVWTETARDGLDGILSYIAEDSPDAAAKVLEVVLGVAESLNHLAHRGRVVPELDQPTIREVFVYSYRMLYRVANDEVCIIGILHGARDFSRWRRGRTLE